MDFSGGRSGGESSSFSSIRQCRRFFFFFYFWFLLGCPCAVCPSSGIALYRLVAILIYLGESLFRETLNTDHPNDYVSMKL